MEPFAFNNTGYRPTETPDPRNWPLESVQVPLTTFPTSHITDITPLKLPQNVYMQYQIPDCVENGIAFAQRYIEWKATGVLPNLCRRHLAINTVNNTVPRISFSQGTNLQVALEQARTKGIGDPQYFPDDHTLDENTFIGASIPDTEVQSGTIHKLPSYAMVTDLSVNGLKNAIAQNGIVIIAIRVSDNWWKAPNGATSWAMNDILPIRPPSTSSPAVSGHCIALYGYDDQYFYFMNWWSPEWGNKGHGWFAANDVPQIYEAAVVGNFTKPTQPAPVESVVAKEESFVEKVVGEIEHLVEVIEDAIL